MQVGLIQIPYSGTDSGLLRVRFIQDSGFLRVQFIQDSTRMLRSKNLTRWHWPWKSIGFQTLLRTKYVPSLVKILWRMLILECSQGCYAVKIWPLDLWPWKSIGFQTLLRTMYVPSLVKIHWRMLILECSQGCYAVKIWPGDIDLWPWKSKGFQTLLRTKCYQ
jgi:hypothetical protein